MPFLNELRRTDPAWCSGLFEHLTSRLGWEVPEVWSTRINLATAPALYRRLMRGEDITLVALLRSPEDRAERLECEVLYLDRDSDDHRMAPDADTALRAGDEILLVGKRGSRNSFMLAIANEHGSTTLTGTDLPGWIWSGRRGEGAATPDLP